MGSGVQGVCTLKLQDFGIPKKLISNKDALAAALYVGVHVCIQDNASRSGDLYGGGALCTYLLFSFRAGNTLMC